MTLRSPQERVFQTVLYEAGGLLLSVPLYVLYTQDRAAQGLALMVALASAVTLWAPLHNAVFDRVDLRLTGRLASDRPHRWRMVHAISLEVTVMAITLPILLVMGGQSLRDALIVEAGLTALYAGYAYGFHLIYDRLWPVQAGSAVI